MQVTFILKNLSPEFVASKEAAGTEALFAWLNKQAMGGDLKHCVSVKVGSGQFRDRVELNQIMRSNPPMAYSIAPRRGYKLATFDIG